MSTPGPELTIIRHGETTWSASGQHTSHTDLLLTERGEQQAKALAGVLADLHFDAVLVSPMQRARRTAELAGLDAFEVDDDLREWDYGDLEGRTTPEIQEEHPGWSIWTGPWVGGETADEVAARADRVVARVLAYPPGSHVAAVGHGHFSRVLGARWLEAPVTAGRWLTLDTAGASNLGWEHDYRVIRRWNAAGPFAD